MDQSLDTLKGLSMANKMKEPTAMLKRLKELADKKKVFLR